MKNSVSKYNSDDVFSSNWLKNFFDLPIINHSNILKTNIKKEGNSYVYEIDVPGFNKEDVKVNYEDGYLVVDASSSSYNNSSSDSYIRQERYVGSCSRSYYIGEVDESKISARYVNGVLLVTIPDEEKDKNYKTKNINIQ